MHHGGPGLFTAADLERSLRGKIEPVRITPLYRAGLAGVACALVLLQGIYVAMAAALAWFTFQYIAMLPQIVGALSGGWFLILAVIGPPFVGILATFFLFKPLLSKAPKPEEPMELRREEAPVLFQFVERVCQMVGSPAPRCINVDLEVNASASLRRGWKSLAGSDLTLTIGLPLVAGLTARQFAGVLAHEFGHFSQAGGMRLQFLIWHVRCWFQRVAYDRDKWDQWLEQQIRQSNGIRLRMILQAGGWAVTLSRLILRGLLHAANWISAWFSRQMEFDADRHGAALVGGETSAEIAHRLALLSDACERSWNEVNESWRYGRLAADFPSIVRHRESRLPSSVREQIVQSLLAARTGKWATHPSAADRIANVKGITGVVQDPLDQPAASLFPDFEALSREATNFDYGRSLGSFRERGKMVALSEFIAERDTRDRREEARQAVFPGIELPSHWFVLETGADPGSGESVDPSEYWRLHRQSLMRYAGLKCRNIWGQIHGSEFGFSREDRPTVEREVREAREALERECAKLRAHFRPAVRKLLAAPEILRRPYEALSSERACLTDLGHAARAVDILLGSIEQLDATRSQLVKQAAGDLEIKCREIAKRLELVACPVALPGLTPAPIGSQLLTEETEPLPLAQELLSRADDLAEMLLGEMCLAIQAEQPAEAYGTGLYSRSS